MSKAFLTSTTLLFALGIGSAQASTTTANTTDTQNQSINMRQQLQDTLSKQGYSDINVMPSSFLVHAKDKKGEPVAMVIGPDSITAVTEITPNKQASSATDQNKGNTQKQ